MKITVALSLKRTYNKASMKEKTMQTFNIQISEDQLNIIKSALQKDSSYSESEEFIIGMIEDTIESQDSESIHGFCY